VAAQARLTNGVESMAAPPIFSSLRLFGDINILLFAFFTILNLLVVAQNSIKFIVLRSEGDGQKPHLK
tara:strand:- start:594 stop:797 length:204 start_codon:yes stop_codon:yes gene_type:complete